MYKIRRFSRFGDVVQGHVIKKDLGTHKTPSIKDLYEMADNQSLAADNLSQVDINRSASKLTQYELGRRKDEVRLNLENIGEANKKYVNDPGYRDLSSLLNPRIDKLKVDEDVKAYEEGRGKFRNGILCGLGDRSHVKDFNRFYKKRKSN